MESKNFNWLVTIFVATLTFSVLLLLSSSNLSATTSNSQVTASVNVPGTLYTSISPNSITWANYPGYSNATNTIINIIDNNGNIPGNIFIWGTATLSNTLYSANIAIGNVLWNPTSSNAFVGNAVTTSQVDTLIGVAAPTLSSPSTNSPIYIGVNIPPGTMSGLYTGSIYFDIENGLIMSQPTTSNVLSVTVNVLPTCYISLSPTSINFGTLATGTTSTTWNGITDTDTGGNAQATIYVYGGNWIYSSNPAISFYVANTVWSPTNSGSYNSGTPLTLSLVNTGIIVPAPTQSNPSTSNTVYFEVAVPGGAPVGAYTQNIVIANQC
ncbi:MAG: hypothetical protein RXO43_02280 [Candidatus Micrarchaeota archaeon]